MIEVDVAETSAVPAPEADDPDGVAVALEAARALWISGEKSESVRLLRRAAEAAEEAGNDLRALALARTAADLTSELQAATPVTPDVVSTPPASSRAPSPSRLPPPLPTASQPPPLPIAS